MSDGFLAPFSTLLTGGMWGLQVIALLVISGVHMAYLRLYAPFLRRVDQVSEMVSAAADVIIFICVLVLVGKDGTSDRSRCALLPCCSRLAFHVQPACDNVMLCPPNVSVATCSMNMFCLSWQNMFRMHRPFSSTIMLLPRHRLCDYNQIKQEDTLISCSPLQPGISSIFLTMYRHPPIYLRWAWLLSCALSFHTMV